MTAFRVAVVGGATYAIARSGNLYAIPASGAAPGAPTYVRYQQADQIAPAGATGWIVPHLAMITWEAPTSGGTVTSYVITPSISGVAQTPVTCTVSSLTKLGQYIPGNADSWTVTAVGPGGSSSPVTATPVGPSGALTVYTNDVTVPPGGNISNFDIHDSHLILGDGATATNGIVRGWTTGETVAYLQAGANCTITDVRVGGGADGVTPSTGANGFLCGGPGTVMKRCEIRYVGDGIHCDGGVIFDGVLVHFLANSATSPVSSPHSDALQTLSVSPSGPINVYRSLWMGGTATNMFFEDWGNGPTSGVDIDTNVILSERNGGGSSGFAINFANTGSQGNPISCRVVNNWISNSADWTVAGGGLSLPTNAVTSGNYHLDGSPA
ncbi:hypothetical protein SAMN05444157_1641 [Frankineae bacterium MT45]|nr:hypothetical protein SAMN05444157_1641 [Frankineae bacterium MT45]